MAKYRDVMQFEWKRPPSALAKDFVNFNKKVNRSKRIAFNKIKNLLVAEAKKNAPWQDQTGDARSELMARYRTISQSAAVDIVNVYLEHGVEYGVFLELANNSRYAIIHDTLVRNRRKIEKILQEALKDFK